MRGVSFTAIVTAMALSMMPAWAAAEPRAGVLPLDVNGELPPQGAKTLSAEVEAGLTSAGATVVSSTELAGTFGGKPKTASKQLAACRDGACLKDLAAKATATHLVRPTVQMDGSDYVLSLELVDGATGEVVHQASQTCELCGLTEAQAMMRSLAESLKDRLASTGTVTVDSTPPGAEVLVDGEPAGTAPLELRLAAGEHTIVLRLAGHADEERRVVVEVGSTAPVTAELTELEQAAPVEPSAPERKLPLGPLGWASIGVGVAAVGTGIGLLILDERPVEYTRCSGIDVDVEGDCRFRHDTLVGGVVMTIVGVVGITAGALLVARSRKAGKNGGDHERRARLRPTLRGFAIQF